MFETSDRLIRDLIEHALADKRGPARWHITRLQMYRSLENKLAAEDAAAKSCLCISQSSPLADVLGLRAVARTITSYPDVNMLELPYEDESFDFVLSDQVLEHVAGDPFQAFGEAMRVARPGGAIVHTTCFINFLHMIPADYWRFSTEALLLLGRHVGAVDAVVGQWGNRDAWTYMQLGYRGHKVPEVPGNPVYELATRSDKRWPVTTWIMMRKPLGPAR